MRILLIGEYSNVHWTLAEGLRSIGHQVIVVSNGDFWKDYPRDISLVREETRLSGIKYLLRFLTIMPKLRGFDVVQVINPMFLELKAERILPIYKYLRKHNKTMFCFWAVSVWITIGLIHAQTRSLYDIVISILVIPYAQTVMLLLNKKTGLEQQRKH